MLRPIGTVFETEYPPSLCCTETRWTRITSRVVAHVDAVIDRVGNTRPMEETKAIDIEYFEKPIVHEVKDGFLTISNGYQT
jgi:hypothetical protein